VTALQCALTGCHERVFGQVCPTHLSSTKFQDPYLGLTDLPTDVSGPAAIVGRYQPTNIRGRPTPRVRVEEEEEENSLIIDLKRYARLAVAWSRHGSLVPRWTWPAVAWTRPLLSWFCSVPERPTPPKRRRYTHGTRAPLSRAVGKLQ